MSNNRTPNLFIAGFFRCGTTSLYNYLKEHPQIYGLGLKEPRFLASEYMKFSDNHNIDSIMTVTNEREYMVLHKNDPVYDKGWTVRSSIFFILKLLRK